MLNVVGTSDAWSNEKLAVIRECVRSPGDEVTSQD